MPNRNRRLPSRQFEMAEATAANLQKNANIGSVGGDRIAVSRQ